MTHSYALGDRDKVIEAFHSVWVLITGILILIIAACLLGYFFFGDRFHYSLTFVHSGHIYRQSAKLAILNFLIYSVVSVEMGIVSAGYQSIGRYAEGTFLFDLLLPIETAIIVSACLLGSGMVLASFLMLISSIIGSIIFYLNLLRREPWMRLGFTHVSAALIGYLVKPALGSVTLTLASALSLQGLIIALGLVFSPSSTAVFAASRLITRAPLQVTGIMSRATLPEMTSAYARSDKQLTIKLVLLNIGSALLIMIPATLFSSTFGPQILGVLSHHKLRAARAVFIALSLTAFFQAIWLNLSQFLIAINKQHTFSHWYLVLAAITAFSPCIVGSRAGALFDVTAIWCAAEFVMVIVVYFVWSRQNRISFRDYADEGRALYKSGLAKLGLL